MIKIDQIAPLVAELFLDLPDDPRRAVADRVNPRGRPEAGADRAAQQLSPGRQGAALDRAGVDRRPVSLDMRQGKLGLAPRQLLAFEPDSKFKRSRLSLWRASA